MSSRRANQDMKMSKCLEMAKNTGSFAQRVRVTGKNGKRRKRDLIIGVLGHKNGASSNPINILAYRIRSALAGHPIPDVIIYDPDGKAIRRLDGLTKQEKPL